MLAPPGHLSSCQLWGSSRTSPPTCLCCTWAGDSLNMAGSPLVTPPALRGGQWPLKACIRHERQVRPRCQSASLEGNKHVLIKTKHFQMGVSCWNFLAAPKAVVIMETLTLLFFFSTGVEGIYNIVSASPFWTETTVVDVRGGSLKSEGNQRSCRSWPQEKLKRACPLTEMSALHFPLL